MMRAPFALAAALLTIPAFAQQPPGPALNVEQRMLLRCSAAFAIVVNQQQAGQAEAGRWPDLSVRGREFFVRSSARLMDETGMDRAQTATLLAQEAQAMVRARQVDQVMPPCLQVLDASGIE